MRTSAFLLARLMVLIALGLPLALRAADKASPASLPNIVVIFVDDMGYGDIGAFGAKGYKTPNIDRMGKEGRVFRNFHVAQAVCSASRAGLHTGCYPNRVGIHGALGPLSKVGLSTNEMTLGKLVKQKGYATALIGKWHLGDRQPFLPLHHGYDEYFGLPYSNDMWPFHPEAGANAQKNRKSTYPELVMFRGTNVVIPKVTPKDQEQLTTWYTERAIDFIKGHRNKPFLLMLQHNMPHVPLFVSDKFRGKTARGLYGDVIAEIDWSVGQVNKALKDAGLEKNTWVIFTSDNGPWLSYGDHAGSALPLREGKGTSWEGGTRVPCVMKWPGKIPAGTQSRDMLMTIDLLPTIANLIGATLPEHKIDGMNVWPLIAGEPDAKNPHTAYWMYYAQNELQSILSADGRWKLILPHTYRTLSGGPGGTGGKPAKYEQVKLQAPELYDLANDVSETANVADKFPDIAAKLQAEAQKAREDLGDSLLKLKGQGTRQAGQWNETPPAS